MDDARRKPPEPEQPPSPARRSFLQAAAGATVAGFGVVGAANAFKAADELFDGVTSSPLSGAKPVSFTLNGRRVTPEIPDHRSLLLTIREDLGLTGTKKGCNMGQCGACTVLLNGRPIYACLTLAADVAGSSITTIEGLERNGAPHALQKAFVERMGSQCGHCTPGMIMSGLALLLENPKPSAEEVRFALSGNLCRCGNYINEVAAVLTAASGGGDLALPHLHHQVMPNYIPYTAGLRQPPLASDEPFREAQILLASDSETLTHLNADMPSLDGVAKATGQARYAGDLGFHADDPFGRPLYAKVLRSPYPHAEVLNIDDKDAHALPGYRGLVTWQDVHPLKHDRHCLNRHARYVGDAVAAVAAEDQYTAQEALKTIRVEWRQLPTYTDPAENLRTGLTEIHAGPVAGFGGPQPFDVPTIEFKQGDVDTGFKMSHSIVEGRYVMPLHCHVPIEPHCCTALSRDGVVRLWDTQQSVFQARDIIADAMNLPRQSVEVHCEYLGGGFGGKCTDTLGKTLYQVIAALLARKLDRPVRLEYTLHEEIVAEDTRNPFIMDIKTGVLRDGTITALHCRALQATGGYASSGPAVVSVCGEGMINSYRIDNYWFEGYSVYTNTPVGGEFRGFGHPQAVFARERHFDKIAAAIGMDPVAFRRHNCKRPGDKLHFTVGNDATLDKIGANECLLLGAKAVGWSRWLSPEKKTGTVRRGLGVRLSHEHSGRANSDGLIWLDRQGQIHLPLGAGNIGTNAHTGIALIAAQVLTIPAGSLHVTWGDTSDTAYDFVTDASRSVHCHGKAIYNAALDLLRQLRPAAARLLGETEEQVLLRDGKFFSPDGSRSIDFRTLAQQAAPRTDFTPHFDPATDQNPLLDEATGVVTDFPPMILDPFTVSLAQQFAKAGGVVGLGCYIYNPSVQSWGASFAEVEVDLETGQVDVLQLVCAHDIGRIIFRRGAEAQVTGGTIMGLGYAMTEQLQIDPNTGVPINVSLYELRPPSSLDVPLVVPILVEAPAKAAPFGAKGLGENPFHNAAPAIANAIFNATGVHMDEIPYTWPRVFENLRRAGTKA